MDKIKLLEMRLEGGTYQQMADTFGVSRQRIQQLLSPPKQIRDYVVHKYDGKCADCGLKVGRAGHVHHQNNDGENYNEIDNLELLCISCHRLRHSTPPALFKGLDGMKLRIFKCKRCGGEWASRSKHPLRCGKCKSPYWDKPRRT